MSDKSEFIPKTTRRNHAHQMSEYDGVAGLDAVRDIRKIILTYGVQSTPYVLAYVSWVLQVPMSEQFARSQDEADRTLDKAFDLIERAAGLLSEVDE